MRRVGIHVRDHDDDVARLQRGIAGKGREQLVVQDLDLALRAVGNMKAQGVILAGIYRGPLASGFCQRAQFENVALQLRQQAVP